MIRFNLSIYFLVSSAVFWTPFLLYVRVYIGNLAEEVIIEKNQLIDGLCSRFICDNHRSRMLVSTKKIS
jgi:hypothetical protein